MKIGTNVAIWDSATEEKISYLFQTIKSMGFDVIEMAIEVRDIKNIELIKNKLSQTGLIGVLCSAFLNGNLITDDDSTFNKGIHYIKDSVDLCEYLGIGILVGPIFGSLINTSLRNPDLKNAAFKRCVEGIKETGKYALEKNIKIAIEPLNRYDSSFINTVDEGLDLVKTVNLPNVGLNLDMYHMNIEEKHLIEAIKKAKEYLLHLHFSENDRGTLGTGHIPLKEISKAIKSMDYNNYAVIECGSPAVEAVANLLSYWRVYDYEIKKMVEESLKYLKEILS
ncbi:MAG: sugar phosphate isomerase/epimerase family protein [Candidatus Humimicrobiaceae bacterium]